MPYISLYINDRFLSLDKESGEPIEFCFGDFKADIEKYSISKQISDPIKDDSLPEDHFTSLEKQVRDKQEELLDNFGDKLEKRIKEPYIGLIEGPAIRFNKRTGWCEAFIIYVEIPLKVGREIRLKHRDVLTGKSTTMEEILRDEESKGIYLSDES